MTTGAETNKSNEWYTPPKYIHAAREVMETIDLDPASCELANHFVKASRYYTIDDNGLVQPWYGSVWCNPPYTQVKKGHSSIAAWVYKTLRVYTLGEIEQAILLIPNDTSTRWFDVLWNYPICFPSRRIKFHILGKRMEQPTFGTCFVYLGKSEQKFIDTFSQFGRIARAIDTPRQRPVNLELWQEVGA